MDHGSDPWSLQPTFRLLDLPCEIRDIIYYYALSPIPTRIHLIKGPYAYWSPVPDFNPGKLLSIPLFMVSKQVHVEATKVFYARTILFISLKGIEESYQCILNSIPTEAKSNIRTVDLHMRELFYRSRIMGDIIPSKETFPKLQNIHLTLEQRLPLSNGRISTSPFPLAEESLSDFPQLGLMLRRVRLFIRDAFHSTKLPPSHFQCFLSALGKLPNLEEVAVYFQAVVHGFNMYPTPTHTPEPAPTRPAYLELERRNLSPYLKTFASTLPQVKSFEIWRLREPAGDGSCGTQPIKENELLDLLGGRAKELDRHACCTVLKRCPDGSALPFQDVENHELTQQLG
jgi:hypothetical protein